MQDPYREAFQVRLKRITRIRRHGGAFEAAGTLGQSYYTRLRRRAGRPVLRPALAIVAVLVTFKAISAAASGPAAYDARLAELRQGHAGARTLAFVMAPDPISRAMAGALQPMFDDAQG